MVDGIWKMVDGRWNMEDGLISNYFPLVLIRNVKFKRSINH
jgi:hypothetical protein